MWLITQLDSQPIIKMQDLYQLLSAIFMMGLNIILQITIECISILIMFTEAQEFLIFNRDP